MLPGYLNRPEVTMIEACCSTCGLNLQAPQLVEPAQAAPQDKSAGSKAKLFMFRSNK